MNLHATRSRTILVATWQKERSRRIPILHLPPRRAVVALRVPGTSNRYEQPCPRFALLNPPRLAGTSSLPKSNHVKY